MIIILIGIALIAAGAFGLFQAYSGEDAGSAALAWGGIILGALVTLFGFGKRTSENMPRPENSDSDNSQAEIRALIQSMGTVAVADKHVRPAEVETIATIHEQMLGMKISEKEVQEILSEFDKSFDITARLKRDLDHISPAMRRTIIQSCHLVMVSDLEVVPSEKTKIYEIGKALGFSQNSVDDMISAVAT